jgi:RNA polymerase sigma factor (sigma-70 family)
MAPSIPDLGQTLQRFRNGDPDAAVQLLEQLREPLAEVIRPLLGQQLSSCLLDEVLQEALLAIWVRLCQRGVNPDAPEAYCCQIARNQALLALRSLRAQKRDAGREKSLCDLTPQQQQALLDRHSGPVEQAAAREALALLLQHLHGRYRDAFQLLLAGHSVPETAAHLGISERTVQRLRAELRVLLPDWAPPVCTPACLLSLAVATCPER